MESIKHKMDTMINEKDTATAKAVELEAEAGQYQQTLAKFEKEVSDVARKIAKVHKLTLRIFPDWSFWYFDLMGFLN